MQIFIRVTKNGINSLINITNKHNMDFFPERLFLNVEHLTKGMLGTYTLDIHIYVVARKSNQPGYLFFENSL